MDSMTTECPTCDRNDFSTVSGMKTHHKTIHGESLAGIEKVCDQCGIEYRDRDRKRKQKNNFCSVDCNDDWKSVNQTGKNNPSYNGGQVPMSCKTCNKDFTVPQHRSKTAKYCSVECRGISDRGYWVGENNPNWVGGDVSLYCEWCDVEFTVPPYRAQTSRFCSDSCFGDWVSDSGVNSGENHPNYNPEKQTIYYGSEWSNYRRDVICRDRYQCVDCEIDRDTHNEEYERDFHVHHIKPVHSFESVEDAHYMSNLVTLCIPCHRKWEKYSPERPPE